MLSSILDHSGSEEQLIEKLKEWSRKTIGAVYNETMDGFNEGAAGLTVLLKEIVTSLIKAACSPSQAMLATMLGVPPIMNYIQDVWYSIQESEPVAAVVVEKNLVSKEESK